VSILGNLLSRLTGGRTSSPPPSPAPRPSADKAPRGTDRPPPAAEPAPRVTTAPPPTAAAATLGANTPGPVPTPQPPLAQGDPIPRAGEELGQVDLAKHLDALAAKSGQTLDWRRSIVDMMKLLGMDSSLTERQALARELGYTGNAGDSARMNIWLHQEVLQRIARNGGHVPPELLH
jgi:hypothetical protein